MRERRKKTTNVFEHTKKEIMRSRAHRGYIIICELKAPQSEIKRNKANVFTE